MKFVLGKKKTTSKNWTRKKQPTENAKLHQPTISQITLNNNIIHSRHDKLNLRRIGSASKMGINLLRVRLVQVDKLLKKELRGFFVVFAVSWFIH